MIFIVWPLSKKVEALERAMIGRVGMIENQSVRCGGLRALPFAVTQQIHSWRSALWYTIVYSTFPVHILDDLLVAILASLF